MTLKRKVTGDAHTHRSHDRVQHGLELALVVAIDASSEEMGGPISAADQHAQFAGALEECSEWCGAFEHDVRRQLHLGHAVAVTRPQRLTFVWAEDWDHSAHPVVTPPLQERRAQAIGCRLQSDHVAHRQEGVVGFAESHFFTYQFLGNERVTVEVARDVEWKVAGDPHAHRPHDRVQHVPVVVQERLRHALMKR